MLSPSKGTGRRRAGAERASVLMLMPAAVLILIVLGAIAVDFSVAFLAQRELSNAAVAAANDAATQAIDLDGFYATGAIHVDAALAREIAHGALLRHGVLDPEAVLVVVDPNPDGPVVTVRVETTVRYLFAGALPGAPKSTTVRAVATATAVEGRSR